MTSKVDNLAFEKTFNSNGNFRESQLVLGQRYAVLHKIGEGTFSQVLLARDLAHPKKRLVALKVLPNKYSRQALTEVIRLRQLSIFNGEKNFQIVQIFDTFNFGSFICIVLEWLSGGPINISHVEELNTTNSSHTPRELELRRLPVTRRITCQLVTTLLLLSKVGVLHADLKPDNILYTQADSLDLKVLDFGNSIGTGELSGYYDTYNVQTLNYRAPEVLFGVPFGLPIDMWSLGCILCETWMGHSLFASITRTEIMGEMSRLLGKFPKKVFKNGKYCQEQFLESSNDDEDAKTHTTQSMANLLKTTDVNFLDFISSLLLYDPSKRLTPGMAIHHPFIADMFPLDFLSDKLYPFLIPLNTETRLSRRSTPGLSQGLLEGNPSTRIASRKRTTNPDLYESCDQVQSKRYQMHRSGE
ncbi:hypothetical protein K7432_003012 [Basidiobolus ranarum]|uniref:Protein kinase domain-containing protein n=1 Tax=Basidiobolus ranarum TaxID=34480 RepID=A0ABR2W6V6_9FUNG